MNNENKLLGTDIKLIETALGTDIGVTTTGDLDLASSEYNLAQAILHRLRTIKGELQDIGHPNYGSSLYDLIGEPNNETTRERIRIIIRNTLLDENRIREIVQISVKSRSINGSNIGSRSGKSQESIYSSFNEQDTTTESMYQEIISMDPRTALSTVDIEISVVPIGSNNTLNIAFPFQLEVA